MDSAKGGSGQQLDINTVKETLENDKELRIILAGGLSPDNVANVVKEVGDAGKRIVAVDVSSGVEEAEVQSLVKIKAFVDAAKSAR